MLVEGDGFAADARARRRRVQHVFAVRGAHAGVPADTSPIRPPDWAETYPALAVWIWTWKPRRSTTAMKDLRAFWAALSARPRRPECPNAPNAPSPPHRPRRRPSSAEASSRAVRDTMRNDAGLNGDIDRIPQLAWLLFLKAFDGLERNAGDGGRTACPAGYGAAVQVARLGRRPGRRPHRRGACRFRQRRSAALSARPDRYRPATTRAMSSRRCSRRPSTGCSPVICCATSSTRSTRSTSPPRTTSTR